MLLYQCFSFEGETPHLVGECYVMEQLEVEKLGEGSTREISGQVTRGINGQLGREIGGEVVEYMVFKEVVCIEKASWFWEIRGIPPM